MTQSIPSDLPAEWYELEQIFANVPLGLALLDRDLRYLRVNSALSGMVRIKADEMIGHTIAELFPDHVAVVGPIMRGVIETGQPLHGIVRELEFEVGHFSSLASYIPIRDKTGAIVAICLVVFETTDLLKAQLEIRKARDAAEAASKAKDQFLAVLSHELRTPLTPVLAMVADLQKREDLPADVRDDLATVRRNVELESRLIDDLLDLTRIAQGKVVLRRESVDAHLLLRHAIDICREDIHSKRLSLKVDLQASPARLSGDPARLQQVFWNLLKNAVKFTPEDGSVSVRSRNEVGQLVVEVQDTGMGIEPDLLPKLFKPFEQGQLQITRQFGGLGLGLTISKAMVDLHGGTITAASAGRGQGATFTVRFPLGGETIALAEPTSPNVCSQARPCRILLVEDHPDTLRVMARLIRAMGYTVDTATTVADAVSKAAGSYDLLISDIGLPDGTGMDILRQIPPLPAIAVSGFGMPEDVEKSNQAGFGKHLVKPINLDDLRRAIAVLLQGKSA